MRQKKQTSIKIGISVHPGKLLAEELEHREMSPRQLALRIGIPARRLTEIVQGSRDITMDTSYRLGLYFGQSPDFWYRMQNSHDVSQFMRNDAKRVAKEVRAARDAAEQV